MTHAELADLIRERDRVAIAIDKHVRLYGMEFATPTHTVRSGDFYYSSMRYWELRDWENKKSRLVDKIADLRTTLNLPDAPPAAPPMQPPSDIAKARFDTNAVQCTSPKDANPKKAYGDAKVPLHLVHPIAIAHEAAAMHSGVVKYGRDNYLESKVEIMTYVGAMLRHIAQYASGERVDAKELVHHLGAVRACCNILLTAEATGDLIDNRSGASSQPARAKPSYAMAQATTFKEVEGIVAHLNKLYPPKA